MTGSSSAVGSATPFFGYHNYKILRSTTNEKNSYITVLDSAFPLNEDSAHCQHFYPPPQKKNPNHQLVVLLASCSIPDNFSLTEYAQGRLPCSTNYRLCNHDVIVYVTTIVLIRTNDLCT